MSSLMNRAAEHISYVAKRAGINDSIITGLNPTEYDSTNPITVFIIQIVIILCFTQGLGYLFSFMKQPKVIAEVVGGVILGPTVMGRIPNFTNAIFPKASMPNLSLVANIGLILFLFLIGVEVDPQVMKKNGRNAALISVIGMILPFGIGAGVAVPVYNTYVDSETTSFGHFLLFVGVAMAITAFPVLCRILTATKLLEHRVGAIVLAAGVGNDVVGWVLLALTLALVNSRTGASAVYILLAAVAWSIFLLWPVKKAFAWLVRKTGSQSGPTPLMMVATLVLVFTSAFFTGIIGVHPIFGGFLAGLVVPHRGGFAISLVEKIDDLVTFLFLPIYFVLSGLNTNMGLLDTGTIWGYIILITVTGWAGKFIGCGGVAYLLKYSWREAGAIGMLMSCKGLVEIIVLNVGLSAGIIDQQLFSAFVVVALVLTFITTPFTLLFFPERVRHLTPDLIKDAETANSKLVEGGSGGREYASRLLVILQKIEHLAPVMALCQMLEPTPAHQTKPLVHDLRSAIQSKNLDDGDISDESLKTVPSNDPQQMAAQHEYAQTTPVVHVEALRLLELTGRMHSVMQSAEKDEILRTDDTLQLFKQFGRLRGLDVTPHIAVVEEEQYPESVSRYSSDLGADLVIIPWTVPTGNDDNSSEEIKPEGVSSFDNIFASEAGSPMYTHFVRRVFNEAKTDAALFVDRGFGSTFTPGVGQHIFLPFFGGKDDRLALRFVVQLCHNPNVTATVVYHQTIDDPAVFDSNKEVANQSIDLHSTAMAHNQLTVGPSGFHETANAIASNDADGIAWTYFTAANVSPPRSPSMDAALHRIAFATTRSASPLTQSHHYAEAACQSMNGPGPAQVWRSMLIVTGRGRRGSTVSHDKDVTKLLASKGRDPVIAAELRKTVGDVGAAMMLGGGLPASASFLVLEAAK